MNARNRRWTAALTLVIASGVVLPAATTEAQSRRGDRWSQPRHQQRESVGTLVIDGNRFNLEGRRSLAYEMAEAFRYAGYRASVHDGCVTVHILGHSPRVSLEGCEYAIRVARSFGRLTVAPYKPNQHRYERPVYRGRHHQTPSRRHWQRWQPRHRGSHCTIGGITIRF